MHSKPPQYLQPAGLRSADILVMIIGFAVITVPLVMLIVIKISMAVGFFGFIISVLLLDTCSSSEVRISSVQDHSQLLLTISVV